MYDLYGNSLLKTSVLGALRGGVTMEEHEHNESHEEHEEFDIEDVTINTEYVLNALIDLLVQKGIISEEELQQKLAEGDDDGDEDES